MESVADRQAAATLKGSKSNAVPLGRLFRQFLDQPQMSQKLDRKKNRQHLAGLQNRGGCPSGWAARVLDPRSLLECGECGELCYFLALKAHLDFDITY